MNKSYQTFDKKLLALIVLVLVVGINIGEFRAIDEKVNANTRAFNVYDTDNVLVEGLKSSRTIRAYYMHWYALSELAPDSTIIIPAGTLSDNNASLINRMFSYGKVANLNHVSQVDESEVLESFDPVPFVVASGENVRENSPGFAVAMEHGLSNAEAERIANGLYINRDIWQPKTSFVLISWDGPSNPFSDESNMKEGVPYFLLIETTLLPEHLQDRLTK